MINLFVYKRYCKAALEIANSATAITPWFAEFIDAVLQLSSSQQLTSVYRVFIRFSPGIKIKKLKKIQKSEILLPPMALTCDSCIIL